MRIYNAQGHQKLGDLTINPDGTVATIVDNAVTDEKLRDSAALSVIGRAVDSVGDPADIVAAAPNSVLHRAGDTLTFSSFGDFGAPPTAEVGLTPVPGSADTFMRSDAAPALDQGIEPTWTGTHTFNLPPYIGITEAEVAGIPGLPLANPGITIRNNPFVIGVAAGVRYNAARVNGTLASPTALATGQTMCAFAGFGYDGTILAEGGGMFIAANGAWTNTSHYTRLDFHSVADGSSIPLSGATVRATIGANAIGAWLRMGVTANGGDGTAAQPALSWSSDTDTGTFRQGTNAQGIAAAGVEVARFDADVAAGHTRFMIYDVDNGTLERVSVGAADSGGVGFKVLRIPN